MIWEMKIFFLYFVGRFGIGNNRFMGGFWYLSKYVFLNKNLI